MERPRSGPPPVDRVSGQPPSDPEWRADALAQSRHSRFDEVFVEPMEDHDAERAGAVCGEITRRALEDFAPALMLLTPAERRRIQALAAFGLTLFDFARQSGLEGEKLSQMNRWSFDLEATLSGSPPGQPVFVLLAATGDETPWPEDALREVVDCARRRALRPRARSVDEVEADALRLAGAVTRALLPEGEGVAATVAALLRLRRLLTLGEDRRRHQAGLAATELPDDWADPLADGGLAEAVERECERLAPRLTMPAAGDLPPTWRRALRYAVLAGGSLLRRAREAGSGIVERPPRLGAGERIFLLLRARWL